MSKKTNCIHAKLDDKDYELFQNNLKKTCLTAGAYIHHLIHGNRIVECPTTEPLEVLRELRKISNSMLKISMSGKWNEKDRDEIRNYATLVQRIVSDIIYVLDCRKGGLMQSKQKLALSIKVCKFFKKLDN